ncbi:MAG: sensor domain-containing diguanylate cyclase, partial [Elusimicrobia bacterium]|nr:sensor domain-containing diguanylate cyclase [Elusimicrobiota bacterium]
YISCDRATVFILDKNEQVYRSRFIIDQQGRIELEENISSASSDRELADLVLGNRWLVVTAEGLSAYLPLKNERGVFGLVRVDNVATRTPLSEDQLKHFQDFVSKFGIGVESALLQERNQNLTDELLILSKINNSIVRTMDLGEALEIILKNIVKHLGVDRVRLFLIEHDKNILQGKIAVDRQGTIRSIEEYKYPVKPGGNEVVEALFSKRVDDIRQKPIINLPIKTRDEYLGVLTIDNVFSKQLLAAEDEKYLLLFANQLGTAIQSIRLAKKMAEATIIDSLTRLYVQKYFNQRLGEELARARRFKQELSLLLLDVDHFKVYNDTYGHPVGDTILQELAKIVINNTREVDFAARFEGDGVAMILPNTPREGSRSVASRIRQLIENHGFVVPNGVINITITLGVATFPGDTDDKEELLKICQEALNCGKAHGRNQVILYSEIF